MSAGDSFTTSAEDDGIEHTTKHESTDGEKVPPASPAGNQDDCTQYYPAERLSCIDKRTDIRAVDDHASWREVARACHVKPGR